MSIKTYIAQNLKKALDTKGLRIINENSERLNQEAEDVLSYQNLALDLDTEV